MPPSDRAGINECVKENLLAYKQRLRVCIDQRWTGFRFERTRSGAGR